MKSKPEIIRKSCLKGAEAAQGVVVVIDVFRAFTCVPLFFRFGAKRVILEADPSRALAFKNELPGSVLVGEVNEVPIEGGDLGNSPIEIIGKGEGFFQGKTVIHRTTAGVRGVAAVADRAQLVILGGFIIARAVARYIMNLEADMVTIVAMGTRGQEPSPEDEACADYLEHLIYGKPYDHLKWLERIVFHQSAKKFIMGTKPYLPREDPIFCLQRDLLDFVIVAERKDGLIEAKLRT
ncbi:MAG: 2-phosphosulfolactate phosphatase [Deltaproteobacteria bacterium]|nr:MAG: 2-phosphosulfolactate phosphatase [Deltaproteobacteria bacterium]